MLMNGKNVVLSNKIVKGRYSFTKEEQNFIYNVISQISKDDGDFKEYKVSFRDIESLEGTVKNYKRFIGFAESMLAKILKIRDESKRETIVCSWFSSLKHKDGNNYVLARFDPLLKPYLIQLKEEFVQAKLPVLLSFKSKYTSRLYLLLKSDFDRQKKHKQNLFVVHDTDDLINQFEMPKSYTVRYSLFKNDFLNKSIDEINEKTDLKIGYLERKTGRKITSIEFCISHKEKTESQLRKEIEQTVTLSDYLPNGLSNNTVEILLDEDMGFQKHDLKNIFEHYKTEDIEQICYELFNCWDSDNLTSRQGYFRGKLKLLNKKKTQNFDFGFDTKFFDEKTE